MSADGTIASFRLGHMRKYFFLAGDFSLMTYSAMSAPMTKRPRITDASSPTGSAPKNSA
jgi:hypothetical protein